MKFLYLKKTILKIRKIDIKYILFSLHQNPTFPFKIIFLFDILYNNSILFLENNYITGTPSIYPATIRD